MTNTTAPAPTHRGRKALVPLATLLVASALAVGSGATFTSTSSSSVAVTAGTLLQQNSKDGQVVLDAANIKPGQSMSGTLTVTNTGSLGSDFSLVETASSNGFGADLLSLTITAGTQTVFSGEFGALEDGLATSLPALEPGQSLDYTFTVTLAQSAGNENQGAKASASYAWNGVQN